MKVRLELFPMESFQVFAHPWWVNAAIVVPGVIYVFCRQRGFQVEWRKIFALSAFALAFGFVEAAVVVYLRAAIGLLPGYAGTLADLRRSSLDYQQIQSINHCPQSLFTIEVIREAATMVMLVSVAMLIASRTRERVASFLWAFAVWDIAYYAGLWATVGWPRSFKALDVLFLIPVPWIAQVWFPLLVSALTLLALVMARSTTRAPASFAAASD